MSDPALDRQFNETKQKIHELTIAVQELREKVKSIPADKAKAQADLDASKTAAKEAEKKVVVLERQRDEIKRTYAEFERAQDRLSDQVRELTREEEKNATELRQKEKQLQDLQRDVNDLQRKMEEVTKMAA